MRNKIFFTILFILTLLSLIFFRHHFSIFYFQNDINKVIFNIEIPKNGEIYACFNKNCDKMQYENGVYFYKLNQQNPLFYNDIIKNIELISTNKKTLEDIKEIDIFVGHNYKKLKIENKISETNFLENRAFSLNFDIENNNKTALQKAGVYFESLFYNWYFYIFCYALILIYLIKFQDRFNFKIKYPLLSILLLAIFLRISHIDFVPLWNDELYTLTYISNMGQTTSFIRAFYDPGNPPIFFMISNIWLYFFNKSVFLIRLLPLILGVLQVYLTYLFLNKILNKKIALIASFLSAINIFMILESNEIRSYIFSMILIIWSFYQFNKLKNNFSYLNILLYCLISILLINTHYYCAIYVVSNFILGLILYKNNRLKFFIANIFSFSTFIPYFYLTALFQSFNPNFNTWLEKPTLDILLNHITFYFGNIAFFILTVIFSFFITKKLKNEERFMFLSNIYAIIFVFISATVFSLFVKPILFERYFCIFLPLLIVNTALILNIDYKTKLKPIIILLVFLFSVNMPKYENFNLFSNINLMAQYSSIDYKNQNKEAYFIIPDKINYINYFPNIPKDHTIVSNYGVREDIDLMKIYLSKTNKKHDIVLYLPEICVNSKIKYSKELNLIKINTSIVPIYKIYID